MPRVEDLYETSPIEIEMVGGYFDGRRICVPDDRLVWLMPIPPSIALYGPEPDVTTASVNVEAYRWTGSVRDDGVRVFQVT